MNNKYQNEDLMKQTSDYIGTKQIKAVHMNRADYNLLRGWELPEDEDGTDEGYLIVYNNNQIPNIEGFDGYVSWSPMEQFVDAYQPLYAMTFGHAIEMLKQGERVQRASWNDKDMWIVLMTAMSLPSYNTQDTEKKVNDRTAKFIGKDTPLNTGAYLAMWTADKVWQPGWLASQADILANDWMVVE